MTRLALLSVSNKEGLVPFAKALTELHGFKIVSSGGTAKTLQESNIEVIKVSDYTNSPEILDGRVKTLHPKIHGGILAKKNNTSHNLDLEKEGIKNIDLVVVNLYPFKETISKPNVNWDEAIENIDIGGPAMIRAAAKNHESVIVLTSPKQYELLLNCLDKGEVSKEMRANFALKAFEHTAKYDINISKWLAEKVNSNDSPYFSSIPLKQKLRYGENPHQDAIWFSNKNEGWGESVQLQGKELSANNLIDLEAAVATICEFNYGQLSNEEDQKAAVIIKHTNPCGVAISKDLKSSFVKALDGDKVSAFGGIVAFNSNVDLETANELRNLFLECIVAPDYEPDAIDTLKDKRNLRLIKLKKESIDSCKEFHSRNILGGLLVQELDNKIIDQKEWKVVTKIKPNDLVMNDLSFAWKVAKHVKSNAIVIASSGQTIGIGAGQMNRVGAAKIALESSRDKAKGAVLASDGFFPFDDTVRLAAKYGITAIIQPGGSIKDSESIAACNDLNISMVLTGKRHFLH